MSRRTPLFPGDNAKRPIKNVSGLTPRSKKKKFSDER